MRTAWLPVGLVALSTVGVLVACGQPFESTTSSGTGSGGAGTATGAGGNSTTMASGSGSGTTSSTMSSSDSSSSTGGMACDITTKCPGIATVCGHPACYMGTCSRHVDIPNMDTPSQVYGDCQVAACLNGALVSKHSDGDLYDDGNSCTLDACKNGMPVNDAKMKGTPCGPGGFCDGAGACVACVDDQNCPDNKKKCHAGYCVADSCTNQQLDDGETDIDCGGPLCAPCPDDKLCGQAADCVSNVCSAKPLESQKTCHHDCADGMKNGQETGVDCGGPICSPRCLPGGGCVVPGDCKSGVCMAGVCVKETCTDGVKNGAEAGVDCGILACGKVCPG